MLWGFFVCIDQYDLFNSAGAEVLARHMQYDEFENKKKRDAKAPADASHYFRPRMRQAGGAILDPELMKFIASKSLQESAVPNGQGKAAEEQALAKKGKAGNE